MKLTREQWLERRRKYMCASDAAAALGLSRWKSPLQLCYEKWGEAEDKPPTEPMIRGQKLEGLVLDMYHDRTGHAIAGESFVVSDTHDWMAATPDGIDLETGELLQIKTVSSWSRSGWGPDGSQEIPDDVMIQVQHEMSVTGADADTVVALFGSTDAFRMLVLLVDGGLPAKHLLQIVTDMCAADGCSLEYAVYPIQRDEEIIDDLIEQEHAFWVDHVLAHEPPPDASIPEKTDMLVEADESGRELLEQLRDADLEIARATDVYDELRAKAEKLIGENAGVFCDAVGKVTFKAPRASAKCDYKSVVGDFGAIDQEACEASMTRHTKTTQGKRVFRKNWNKE